MRKFLVLIAALLLCGVVTATAGQPYRLGPGDELQISVWGHEDLQAEVVVLPDGTIFFPLVNQVKLAGLTIMEAQQLLTEELAVYVKDPVVSLIVKKERTIEVKVLGEVAKPGIYRLKPGSLIMDDIAAAGGPTRRAELRKVGVFDANGPTPKVEVRIGKRNRIYKNALTVGPALAEGDTIYVPETLAPNWPLIFSYINGMNSLRELLDDDNN